MKLRWIISILAMTSHSGIAQIFPISSLLHYFDKSYPYYVTHSLETANNDIVPVTLMPYSTNTSDASLSNNTILLQGTRTTILSNISNTPLNITSQSYTRSWNNSSNFKSRENTLITSSSNDQPSVVEPWTREYEDVFGNYGLKAAPSRINPVTQKVKKLKPKYDQVAFVYPPGYSHPPPHQGHPPPLPHPSHPPHPNHYVIVKPYESSAEIPHKLDLNPLVPPSNEVTIDYYVTSSSPTYFEEPEISYFPPGVEHINPMDSDIMHTKKHYSKNIHRPSAPPLSSQVPHAYHPYPFYNQQQVFAKPTPSYPPVKKFIATVRPIYASAPPQPPIPGPGHTTHIIKYSTPSSTRYRVMPTLVDPLVEHSPVTIMGPTKTTPHDLLLHPRIPPLYYHDHHHPYSTVGPYTLSDIKQNRNLLKQFNKFVNQKEKRKKKKKKNETEDEDDGKNTKEEYDVYEYDDKGDKDDDDDNEDTDDDDDYPRKRKMKKNRNRHKNNKIEESRVESTRLYPRQKLKMNNKVKEPYKYSGEAFEKYLNDNYPPIPKNHKLEQMDFGSWEKKGFAGESLEMEKQPFDDYKTQGTNQVNVKHDLQADAMEQTKSMVQNSDGQRVEFQMHGQGGPESYKFGYDTGAGYNRMFRYEERNGEGHVKGHYGYYDENGKLQVFNYAAHPEHGFQAEQTKSNYDNDEDGDNTRK